MAEFNRDPAQVNGLPAPRIRVVRFRLVASVTIRLTVPVLFTPVQKQI